MKNLLACLASGALFAAGLNLAGMTSTANVRGFLDVFGAWDPRLAFVMAAALAIVIPCERWLSHRSAPLLEPRFESARSRGIDAKLLVGAALFGVGWGLTGLCPGPLVVLLGSFRSEVWLVAAASIVGTGSAELLQRAGAVRAD